MLINFSFENFKSYRGAQQFSMELTKTGRKRAEARGRSGVVATSAGIYGANASGKSAFCDALEFVKGFVLDGVQDRDFLKNHLRPFLLDADTKDDASSFLVEFSLDDVARADESEAQRISFLYEFCVSNREVESEELKIKTQSKSRYARLFSRYLEEDGSYSYAYGPTLKGAKKQLEKMTRRDALYLSILGATDNESAQLPLRFFDESLLVCDSRDYEKELSWLAEDLQSASKHSLATARLMRLGGFGIDEVISLNEDGSGQAGVNSFAKQMAEQGVPGAVLSVLGPKGEGKPELLFKHRGADGSLAVFGLDDESDGTRNAMAFFSLALRALNEETTLIIDEIDTSLHPILVRQLVELFESTTTNPHGSQLVFTSHDVSLIMNTKSDLAVLDRDQIWLVNKDRSGESELVGLSEYKGRYEENYGRNYLNGIYGAIPDEGLVRAFSSAQEILRR